MPKRGQDTASDEPATPAQVSAYVARMVAELLVMARDAKLDPLPYLLEMVLIEAEQKVREFEDR
jgi:hypothetical protein